MNTYPANIEMPNQFIIYNLSTLINTNKDVPFNWSKGKLNVQSNLKIIMTMWTSW